MSQPSSTATTPIRVQRWVVVVSISLFALKILAYYLTGSVAVLTDALESTVNVVTSFIGLYSLRIAAKPRDQDHPYGHGKVELLSASFEGALILVAGLMIVYESLNNLLHPHPVQQLDTGIMLIGFTAAANYALGAWCIRTARTHHSVALEASGRHLQSDTWTTLGIIGGLVLLKLTGIGWIDSGVALFFAIFIIVEGYKIVRQTVSGIVDEADLIVLNDLIQTLDTHKQAAWIDLHNLRMIKYGSVLHFDCHLTVPWYYNVLQAHTEVSALEQLIAQNFPQSIEMFVHTDGCIQPYSCLICPLTECPVRRAPFEGRVTWTLENVTSNQKHGMEET